MLRELALPKATTSGVNLSNCPSFQFSPLEFLITRKLSSGRPGLRRHLPAVAPIFIAVLGGGGLHVDTAGQLSELLICFFFFIESLLQESQCPVFSQKLCV